MLIKLFMVHRIDYAAVKPLASLIYSHIMLRRMVRTVVIGERNVEFERPAFINNASIPLATEGMECRGGVIYAKSGDNANAAAAAYNSSQYEDIVEALRHFCEGYLTEITV